MQASSAFGFAVLSSCIRFILASQQDNKVSFTADDLFGSAQPGQTEQASLSGPVFGPIMSSPYQHNPFNNPYYNNMSNSYFYDGNQFDILFRKYPSGHVEPNSGYSIFSNGAFGILFGGQANVPQNPVSETVFGPIIKSSPSILDLYSEPVVQTEEKDSVRVATETVEPVKKTLRKCRERSERKKAAKRQHASPKKSLVSKSVQKQTQITQEPIITPVKTAVSVKPEKSKLDYIVDFLSPEDYSLVNSGIDPRDIAYAYTLVGERAFTNVLCLFAAYRKNHLGDLLNKNVVQFEAEMQAEASSDPDTLYDDLQKILPGITIEEFFAAIDVYKKRRSFAHPKQTGIKFGKGASNCLVRHLNVLHGTKNSGFLLDSKLLEKIAMKTNKYYPTGYTHKSQPFAGHLTSRPDDLSIPVKIDMALAILYVNDYCLITKLYKLRKQVAHDQGEEKIYQATVDYVFAGHPYRSFFRSLEFRNREVSQQ